MTTFSQKNIHTEKPVQEYLIEQLVANEGYRRRDAKSHYDVEMAVDRELVLQFVQTTQPEAWKRLKSSNGTSFERVFFKRLEQKLRSRGTLDVLRNGIRMVPSIAISLCYFRPASELEPRRVSEYRANILSVMAEVEYSKKSGNRIDIVLFVNGIPAVTIEAKNNLTGTSFRDAEQQYMGDRSPKGEPLLTFKRGALVHFALDETHISMTTRLQNGQTKFLPFNRGQRNGGGNPDIVDEHPIAWLYRPGEWGDPIFSRSVLLDIIGKFLLFDTRRKELIFPRYHQLAAVRKVISHAKDKGTGNNYLIQHSAGSGKSNTIAWLAHRAINLHDEHDEPVFNTAIIVSDRIVLDRQLQGTVSQFEQTAGVVRKIDGTSKELKQAIESGARIIVTTIQKFSTEHLLTLYGQSDKTFAVIVDEAHSGQSGKSAVAMTSALTREEASSNDIEVLIAESQQARGPQKNISFFAFTATPKNVTLEHFGTPDENGLKHPFHIYSMRQAIAEGFILDVLQNYITYDTYYQIEKTIAEDPELNKRRGQQRVAQYANLHPTAIGQKVGIIISHFRRHVVNEIRGRAKAMIVTRGREEAYRYFIAVKKYLDQHNIKDIKALVAFSGTLEVDGASVTEANLNRISETQLPKRFNGDDYQILIVAEKYQTGFDQPKLCAMYVHKQLRGVRAVQTLSRLNRPYSGKSADSVYVLDFENTADDIAEAFRPYLDETSISDHSDPNQIFDLHEKLFEFGYLDLGEINRFAEKFFIRELTGGDRASLEALLRVAVKRFSEDEDGGRQEEFRQTLKSFCRFYIFISQIMKLDDTDLEKCYVYGGWLYRLLPNRDAPPEIEITNKMLELQKFRIEKRDEGGIKIAELETKQLSPISAFGARYSEDERKELSEIIRTFNDYHGTNFTEEDIVRFEKVDEKIMNDEKIINYDLPAMLRNNPEDVVYKAYSEAFFKEAVLMLKRERKMESIILSDSEAREKVVKFFFHRARKRVRQNDFNNVWDVKHVK